MGKSVICPHCNEEIEDALIAKHLAAKGGKSGGKKSRRIITPEQQAKMQEARKKKSPGEGA